MSFRIEIANSLKSIRPNLSDSSLKTYSSILFNLYKKLSTEETTTPTTEWFNNSTTKILKHLEDKNRSTKKSTLSALFVLTGNPTYQEEMMAQIKIMNNEYKNQKKTKKQEDNWISIEEINKKYKQLYDKVILIFSKKMVGDVETIMDYLLVAFLSGHLIPPRRSLDYALLKWKNFDPKTDNYYKRGKIYLNKYKTSDTYGMAKIDVPKELDAILKKWLKVNPSDYVLISSNNKPLSSSQITRMLNDVFGKKVSVNMLRHIYLTSFYKDVPPIRDMEKVANQMGHSIKTAFEYVKR